MKYISYVPVVTLPQNWSKQKCTIFNIHFSRVICFKATTKTCRYNLDPLKPNLYIVKLGFTGAYITFLISAQKIDGGYSLVPPRRGGSNEYLQSMF